MESCNNNSTGSDSGGGSDEDDEDGRSSTRSVSVSRSNQHYHHHLDCVTASRRQTRSMRKDISLPSPEADEVLVDKERFSMTLRERSQRKRKRLYDSEEDEEEDEGEDVDEEEESMDGVSEDETVGERRHTTRRKGRPRLKQEEIRKRSTRNLRKRPKRTNKYFDDERC